MAGSTVPGEGELAQVEHSSTSKPDPEATASQPPKDDKDAPIENSVSGALPAEPTPSGDPQPPANLPAEAPPLPDEAPPVEDDGWSHGWDNNANAFYFYNRFTGVSQWENPRVPDATLHVPHSSSSLPPGVEPSSDGALVANNGPSSDRPRYNPAIHGSYDPDADYAKADAQEAADAERESDIQAAIAAGADPAAAYAATGRFNRFTGKWQRADLNPENFNDENKSHRQQNAFFDVQAAANSHDGRSLKQERQNKKLSKDEVQAYRNKKRAKKEEKRRAWLRD